MPNSKQNYRLQTKKRLVKDAASVKFHVDNNDYFGTAATLIALIKKKLEIAVKKAPLTERRLLQSTFRNLERDLLILQKNYHIRANKLRSQKDDKGKLKSQ